VRTDMGSFIVALLLGIMMATFTCGILGGVTSCGLLMMCFRKMLYGRTEVGNLFDGFQRALWAILGAILFGVIGLIVELPLQIVQYVATLNGDRALAAVVGLLNYPYSFVIGPLVGGVLFFA